MLVDQGRLAWGDGRWVAAGDLTDVSVPQTITALLAARLEGLPEANEGSSTVPRSRADLPPRRAAGACPRSVRRPSPRSSRRSSAAT